MPAQPTVTKRTAIPTTPRRWKSLRISSWLYGLFALVLFMGVIGLAQAVGFWSTTGRTTSTGAPITVTGADPAEIKGWMTIGDILKAYKVSREALNTRFGIPADVPDSAALKDLEAVAPAFSVTELRVWLEEQK